MKEHQELSKAVVEKIDSDLLVTKYKAGSSVFEEDAAEIDGAHLTMSQGNDMYIIVDLSEGEVKIDKSAEEFYIYKGKMMPFTKAIAIVTQQKSSVFSKIFSRPKKALYPTKEFSSVEDAKTWIRSLN